MLRRLIPCVLAAGVALSAAPAEAHPHVFVTVKSTVVYADGKPTAVRHDWRFDDMFSAFAVQGLDKNGDGNLDRGELQDLAEVNVTSLKEFDFFTFGKVGPKDVTFKPPVDYWLDHDGTGLTLHFTLPVASAVPEGPFRMEIYDPSYFVAFNLAETGAAALEGAPDGCRIDAEAPAGSQRSAGRLPEADRGFLLQSRCGQRLGRAVRERHDSALRRRCGGLRRDDTSPRAESRTRPRRWANRVRRRGSQRSR